MDKKKNSRFSRLNGFLKQPIAKDIIVPILISVVLSSAISYLINIKIDRYAANRDFIFNFSRVFFDNPKYRNLSVALEESYVYQKGNIFKVNGGSFSDYDVDDYLGLLYDLYAYGEESLVKYGIIDDQFHYYVCIAYQNKEIRDYRKRLSSQGFSKTAAHGFLDDFAAKLGINDSCNCKDL
jgi:hypothetical protein